MFCGKWMTPMIRAQGISGCHSIRIKNNINDQNFFWKNMKRELRNYKTIKYN